MVSTKLLSSDLQHAPLSCLALVVFGPFLSSVFVNPAKLEFFKPCDPTGWNRSHHGDHQVKKVPVVPLGGSSGVSGTVGAAGSGGVMGESKGLRGVPAGLGETLKADNGTFQVGDWTVTSISCKKLGSYRMAVLSDTYHGFEGFLYPSNEKAPKPKQFKPNGNQYGLKAMSPTPFPDDLVHTEDLKFVSELKKVLAKSEAQKWTWDYLGPAQNFTLKPIKTSTETGVLISQGHFDCTADAAKKADGKSQEIKFQIMSGAEFEPMPFYDKKCEAQFGYVPILNEVTNKYSFEGKNGAAQDLDITRTSGFVWKGGPKLWVAQGHENDRDVWYNDWFWEGHPKTLSDTWHKHFPLTPLQLAQNNNDWEKVLVHIPEKTSVRVYQGAVVCGEYRIIGFVAGVRSYKAGTNECVPFSGTEDTLGLGNCEFCKPIDACDEPTKLCDINCDAMKVFNQSLFFY